MSLNRQLRRRLQKDLETFRVVCITGARQTGKTTLAKQFTQDQGRHYVTLDDLAALSAAKTDPQGFIAGLRPPVTIDEIQRSPELLLPIKSAVDNSEARGQFLLTGSSDPLAAQTVKETLAGRMAMVPLRPLTWAERLGRPDFNPLARLRLCQTPRQVADAFASDSYAPTPLDQEVLLGGFPEPVLRLEAERRPGWHDEYLRTVLERELPLFVRLDDVAAFIRYVRLLAGTTGNLINLARLARDAGVSTDTSGRWLSILQSMFLAETLHPHWTNLKKRLTKCPKVHWTDTGMAAALLGVRDWDQAQRLGLSGPFTESWVHHHLRAFAADLGAAVALFFFRSTAGEECDALIAFGSILIPLEVKTSQTPTRRDASGLTAFLKLHPGSAPFGILLYPGTRLIPLSAKVLAIPMSAFLAGTEPPEKGIL